MKHDKDIVNHTVATRIEQYVMIRDHLKQLEAEYEKAKKPFTDMLEELNGVLQQFLDESGGDSLKTKFGTCYKSTRYSASLADSEAFMNYVIQSERFELLDRKANSTAVRDFVEEVGNLPPGCNLTAKSTVGVRRGTGEKSDD